MGGTGGPGQAEGFNDGEGSLMADHPNIALIRDGFDAFNRADLDHLSKLLANDCVQHMAGSNRFTGDHKGRDTILAMYGELGAETDGTFRATLERLYANDHRVVATFRSTATRKGKKLDQQSTLVFEITGGKVTDMDELAIDGKVDDAFWA
jgi:ketosteroid isomerase-like protein